MIRLTKVLNKHLTNEEIMLAARKINQSYYAYMIDDQVWDLLNAVFPVPVQEKLHEARDKQVGHNVVNEILMNYYPCERQIKYYLTKRFLRNSKEVTLFEMRIEKSRLDFGRINGSSHAYEIKTELDTLNKLEKQINDYSKVFEFINVVVHPKHLKKVKEIIPEYCGIEIYNIEPQFEFHTEREAEKNPLINSRAQIDALTTKDLDFVIHKTNSIMSLNKRKDKEEYIYSNFSCEDINSYFKEAIKQRYRDRWTYICKQFNKINPIDIQELFVGPIDPGLIYYKNSSIV